MILGRVVSLFAALGILAGLLTGGAQAATLSAAPAVGTQGTRIVVKFTGKRPGKASVKVGGKRYALKRSGKVWRTKPLSADVIAGAAGRKAKVRARIGGKTRNFKVTIAGSTNPNPNPQPPGPAPAQTLFAVPGVDRTGNDAYEAVKGYFANSMLTDCPAGWGVGCSVEERYSVFADGTHWYCRLTPTAGSDIRSVGTITRIVGAEQKADGAWAVSFEMDSYGNTVYYTVRVDASGAGAIQHWGPGVSPNGAPSEVKTGLTWIRGAKDCSY